MTVVVAGLLAVLFVLGAWVVEIGVAAVHRAQAQAAADAAALAGADAGPGQAHRLAVVNGGVVVESGAEGDGFRVRVGVGDAEAVAVAVPGTAFPESTSSTVVPGFGSAFP